MLFELYIFCNMCDIKTNSIFCRIIVIPFLHFFLSEVDRQFLSEFSAVLVLVIVLGRSTANCYFIFICTLPDDCWLVIFTVHWRPIHHVFDLALFSYMCVSLPVPLCVSRYGSTGQCIWCSDSYFYLQLASRVPIWCFIYLLSKL